MLEKHLIRLLNRLDGYEHVREQLELKERPSSLIESRDSVRRHVDAQDIIAKVHVHVSCISTCMYMYTCQCTSIVHVHRKYTCRFTFNTSITYTCIHVHF